MDPQIDQCVDENDVGRIANVSAVVFACTPCTAFPYDGKVVSVPLATEQVPFQAMKGNIVKGLLVLYGCRPEVGEERAYTPTRGSLGLTPWYSSGVTPEDPRDLVTMERIRKQQKVLAGAEKVAVREPQKFRPWIQKGVQEGQAAGAMPDSSWTHEMLNEWIKLNEIAGVPETGSLTKRIEIAKAIGINIAPRGALRPPKLHQPEL